MITDPLASSVMGAIFFTTTKPASDICGFGGITHLWALKYDTGGTVPSSILRGQALLQVSTGSIEKVDLSSDFTQKEGRRTPAIQGVHPQGNPPGILVPPPPIKKIFHIRER